MMEHHRTRRRLRIPAITMLLVALVAGLVGAAASPAAATSRNPNLKWFGYYYSDDALTQVQDHSNFITMFHPTWRSRDELIWRLTAARNSGVKVLVDITSFFYTPGNDPDCNNSREFLLRGDSLNDTGGDDPRSGLFKPFWRAVTSAGLQDAILGFYNIDEPANICVTAHELAWVGDRINEIAPGKILAVTYGGRMPNNVPGNHAWIGYDNYVDVTTPSGAQAYSNGFFALRNLLNANQKMVVVPDAYVDQRYTACPPNNVNVRNNLINRATWYMDWAQTHPSVTAVYPFIWQTGVLPNVCGLDRLSFLQNAYRIMGQKIKNNW